MSKVAEWETSVIRRNLAQFSSHAVDELGTFLMTGKKGPDFGDVCSRIDEFFSYLREPDKGFLCFHSPHDTLQFTRSGETVRTIYRTCQKLSKATTLEGIAQAWAALQDSARQVQEAKQAETVKEEAHKLIRFFSELSRSTQTRLRDERHELVS